MAAPRFPTILWTPPMIPPLSPLTQIAPPSYIPPGTYINGGTQESSSNLPHSVPLYYPQHHRSLMPSAYGSPPGSGYTSPAPQGGYPAPPTPGSYPSPPAPPAYAAPTASVPHVQPSNHMYIAGANMSVGSAAGWPYPPVTRPSYRLESVPKPHYAIPNMTPSSLAAAQVQAGVRLAQSMTISGLQVSQRRFPSVAAPAASEWPRLPSPSETINTINRVQQAMFEPLYDEQQNKLKRNTQYGIQAQAAPGAHMESSMHSIAKQNTIEQFIALLQEYGPQEPSSERILNLFLALTTYERKVIMRSGSIKAFLKDEGIVNIMGKIMVLCHLLPNKYTTEVTIEEDNEASGDEIDEQQLLFEQKASSHGIHIESPKPATLHSVKDEEQTGYDPYSTEPGTYSAEHGLYGSDTFSNDWARDVYPEESGAYLQNHTDEAGTLVAWSSEDGHVLDEALSDELAVNEHVTHSVGSQDDSANDGEGGDFSNGDLLEELKEVEQRPQPEQAPCDQVRVATVCNMAVNTMDPFKMTTDRAINTERLAVQNQNLQAGSPQVNTRYKDAETSTNSKPEDDDELIETIDSLQYDEMVARATIAEEMLVLMQAEMYCAEGRHLIKQIEAAFQRQPVPDQKAGLETYMAVRENIQDQLSQLEHLAEQNIAAIRDGAWLNTLPLLTWKPPYIPSELSELKQPQEAEQSHSEESRGPVPPPKFKVHASEANTLESVNDSQPSTRDPSPAPEMGPGQGQVNIACSEKRSRSVSVSSDYSDMGHDIVKPPGFVKANSQEEPVWPGNHTIPTEVEPPLPVTPNLEQTLMAQLAPLLPQMMMSLAQMNPMLAMQPQLLQATAMQHLLGMLRSGLVPGMSGMAPPPQAPMLPAGIPVPHPGMASHIMPDPIMSHPTMVNQIMEAPVLANPVMADSMMFNPMAANSMMPASGTASTMKTNPLVSGVMVNPVTAMQSPMPGQVWTATSIGCLVGRDGVSRANSLSKNLSRAPISNRNIHQPMSASHTLPTTTSSIATTAYTLTSTITSNTAYTLSSSTSTTTPTTAYTLSNATSVPTPTTAYTLSSTATPTTAYSLNSAASFPTPTTAYNLNSATSTTYTLNNATSTSKPNTAYTFASTARNTISPSMEQGDGLGKSHSIDPSKSLTEPYMGSAPTMRQTGPSSMQGVSVSQTASVEKTLLPVSKLFTNNVAEASSSDSKSVKKQAVSVPCISKDTEIKKHPPTRSVMQIPTRVVPVSLSTTEASHKQPPPAVSRYRKLSSSSLPKPVEPASDIPNTEEDWGDEFEYETSNFVLNPSNKGRKVMLAHQPTVTETTKPPPVTPTAAISVRVSQIMPANTRSLPPTLKPKVSTTTNCMQVPVPVRQPVPLDTAWANIASSGTADTAKQCKPLPIVASSVLVKPSMSVVVTSSGFAKSSGTTKPAYSEATKAMSESGKNSTTARWSRRSLPDNTLSLSETATEYVSNGGMAGLCDFISDESYPELADDENWQEPNKMKKKRKLKLMVGDEKEDSNFDKCIAAMLCKFPNLTRTDTIKVIREVRQQRGSLRDLTASVILMDASDLIKRHNYGQVATDVKLGGSLLYKTQICGYWKNGSCVSGDQCVYAHGKSELRAQPKHIMCSNWKKNRTCSHGENCIFAHGDKELSQAASGYTQKHKKEVETKKSTATSSTKASWATIPDATNKHQARSGDHLDGTSDSRPVCVICCDRVSVSCGKTLECGHVFHANCILRWIEGEERTCPTCRSHALLVEDYPMLG